MDGRPSVDTFVGSPADCSAEVRQARLYPIEQTTTRPRLRGNMGIRQRGSLTIGLGIALGVLTIALAGTGWLYKNALQEKARIEGEYEAFKEGVKKLGEEAEAKRLVELEKQRRNHEKAVASLKARVAAANARANELCKQAGLSAGCSSLPPVPSTARPTDDASFNERLLEVLRHAQAVADQLAELQEWVAAQRTAI